MSQVPWFIALVASVYAAVAFLLQWLGKLFAGRPGFWFMTLLASAPPAYIIFLRTSGRLVDTKVEVNPYGPSSAVLTATIETVVVNGPYVALAMIWASLLVVRRFCFRVGRPFAFHFISSFRRPASST